MMRVFADTLVGMERCMSTFMATPATVSRRWLVIGTALFGAGSLICALSGSLEPLLFGRALQGVGAGLLLPNSLALLNGAYEGEARGRAIGTWAAAGAIAAAIAPLLGGWLVDHVGWQSIFYINLPFVAAAIVIALARVKEVREPEKARLDLAGAADEEDEDGAGRFRRRRRRGGGQQAVVGQQRGQGGGPQAGAGEEVIAIPPQPEAIGLGGGKAAERGVARDCRIRRNGRRVRAIRTGRRDRQRELPLGILGDIAHSLKVRSDLERIFGYRRDRIQEIFAG